MRLAAWSRRTFQKRAVQRAECLPRLAQPIDLLRRKRRERVGQSSSSLPAEFVEETPSPLGDCDDGDSAVERVAASAYQAGAFQTARKLRHPRLTDAFTDYEIADPQRTFAVEDVEDRQRGRALGHGSGTAQRPEQAVEKGDELRVSVVSHPHSYITYLCNLDVGLDRGRSGHGVHAGSSRFGHPIDTSGELQ